MGWTKRFLILAALVMASLVPASAQAPKRVALVIANAAYASANVLTNPTNDAAIVTAALRRAGFQTVQAKNNLGIAAFQRALRDFQAQADGAQIALIYYAGHGIEGNGRNWLIPTDAVLNTERDLAYEAINLDLVMETVQGADLRVVILDACRNNPLGRNWRRGSRAVTRGLGGVDADDVLVIYAAAPGETASDGTGVNSPFATALAQRLPQPDLAIQLLGGMVRDDVLRTTGGMQRPFVSASITGTPFYLVPRAAGALAAPPPPPPPAPVLDAGTLESAPIVPPNNAASVAAGAYVVLEILRRNTTDLPAGYARRMHIAPSIPSAIANNARAAGQLPSDSELLAVYDSTVAGNGRTGVYFLRDGLVSKGLLGAPQFARYADLRGMTPTSTGTTVAYGPISLGGYATALIPLLVELARVSNK